MSDIIHVGKTDSKKVQAFMELIALQSCIKCRRQPAGASGSVELTVDEMRIFGVEKTPGADQSGIAYPLCEGCTNEVTRAEVVSMIMKELDL